MHWYANTETFRAKSTTTAYDARKVYNVIQQTNIMTQCDAICGKYQLVAGEKTRQITWSDYLNIMQQ